VHPISPGPAQDPRRLGLKDFDLLLNEGRARAPVGELVDIMDVGFACAYLATPYARRIPGETLYVDGGVNIMAWRAGAPPREPRPAQSIWRRPEPSSRNTAAPNNAIPAVTANGAA
jgi:hypothetical protein